MSNLMVGDRVLLRYAPYGSSGMVTALTHGKAQVRWGDLELTTRHAPASLVLCNQDLRPAADASKEEDAMIDAQAQGIW
jgi:hypothetical protein